MQNLLDATIIKAIKQCVTGLKLTETTSEYVLDEDTGQMKLVKQKMVEKTVPPNTDIIKLLYQKTDEKTNYSQLTDEELENTKQRLLKQLKENESDSSTSKNKGKV